MQNEEVSQKSKQANAALLIAQAAAMLSNRVGFPVPYSSDRHSEQILSGGKHRPEMSPARAIDKDLKQQKQARKKRPGVSRKKKNRH